MSRGEGRPAGSPQTRRASALAAAAAFVLTAVAATFVPPLALTAGAGLLLALVVARVRGGWPPLLRGLAFGCWTALLLYVALALVNALFAAPGAGSGAG